MTPKSHFKTSLDTLITVNTKTFKVQWSCLPCCSCSVAINVTVKGLHAGPNLLYSTSLPVCLSKQQNATDNTTAEQSHWVTQKSLYTVGYSDSCTWMKWDDTHYAWDENMLDIKKHRHQAESDSLSDTYSMTPEEYMCRVFKLFKTDQLNSSETSASDKNNLPLTAIISWNKYQSTSLLKKGPF